MSKLKKFVLWNAEKCLHHFKTECDTFEKLTAAELENNGCLHSNVNLTDNQLIEVLQAVYNETDIELHWAEIK